MLFEMMIFLAGVREKYVRYFYAWQWGVTETVNASSLVHAAGKGLLVQTSIQTISASKVLWNVPLDS